MRTNYYVTTPLVAEGFSVRDIKRKQSQAIDQHVTDFIAKGGTIVEVPFGASSLPYGTPFDSDAELEAFRSPRPLPGSAPHDPTKVGERAQRRARRYGRLPNAR